MIATRPDWMPLDPDASPREQILLDEANVLLLALRTAESGEAITGTRMGASAELRIMARVDAIQHELARPSKESRRG